MRRISLSLCWIVLLGFIASASAQPAQAPIATNDGGTSEVLQSIFIPPIAHAPFSLTLETEWSRPLGTGGSYTLANRRHIMRDSAGRIYGERWILVPKGGSIESTMNLIQITDPAAHTLYNCDVRARRCFLSSYRWSTGDVFAPATGKTGPLPDGKGYHLHEELGTGSAAGVLTTGYRETTTLNPGTFGNDQPMITTREFWLSPRLGINLFSKVDSPRVGKQIFTVTEISTTEPEARYFALPEGYAVVDQRGDLSSNQ